MNQNLHYENSPWRYYHSIHSYTQNNSVGRWREFVTIAILNFTQGTITLSSYCDKAIIVGHVKYLRGNLYRFVNQISILILNHHDYRQYLYIAYKQRLQKKAIYKEDTIFVLYSCYKKKGFFSLNKMFVGRTSCKIVNMWAVQHWIPSMGKQSFIRLQEKSALTVTFPEPFIHKTTDAAVTAGVLRPHSQTWLSNSV